MDSRSRRLLDEGKVSWNKAKGICRKILATPPDKEKEGAVRLIEEFNKHRGKAGGNRRVLSLKKR